jgi:hypothetical protein
MSKDFPEYYGGPRIGDTVAIEARGTVVEMQTRGGVAGVLVELPGGHQVWVPLGVASHPPTHHLGEVHRGGPATLRRSALGPSRRGPQS